MTSPAKPAANGGKWRIDFSLALFNRSGKFQIGQEILAHNAAMIDSVWYWRWRAARVPTGLLARVLGKAEKLERDWHRARGNAAARARPWSHRWLHLDPLTVIHRRPAPGDAVLVHDLGPRTHPELFAPGTSEAYDLAFRILANSAARLVFVSRDSRDQFASLYGAKEAMEVIYPPIAARLQGEARRAPAGVQGRFLLTVGAIGLRKNQACTIEAFAASGLAGRGFSYVLCGSREPGFEAVAELAARTEGVRLLPFVSDEELRWLYAHASGFVLASQLEGFGMPVAEAMAFGLVPLVTAGSVLKEVAGEAALQVNPSDIAGIAAAMRQLAEMEQPERARREGLMQERLGRFSHTAFNRQWAELLGGESC